MIRQSSSRAIGQAPPVPATGLADTRECIPPGSNDRLPRPYPSANGKLMRKIHTSLYPARSSSDGPFATSSQGRSMGKNKVDLQCDAAKSGLRSSILRARNLSSRLRCVLRKGCCVSKAIPKADTPYCFKLAQCRIHHHTLHSLPIVWLVTGSLLRSERKTGVRNNRCSTNLGGL